MTDNILFLLIGFIIFLILLIASFAIGFFIGKKSGENTNDKELNVEELTNKMKETFQRISQDSLLKQQESILGLASSKLEEKTKHTDDALRSLNRVTNELKGQLTESSSHIQDLSTTANNLKSLLSSNQQRGQWGEKMVKDILDFIGLKEKINYVQQKEMDNHSKPDFTFFLPRDRTVNLDVKFPLAEYERYLALVNSKTASQFEKDQSKKKFLQDVKNRVRELQGRGYIEQGKTVDYVLMFIPNESIFAFINNESEGSSIIDEALKNKIVLCAPFTLYAVLSLIRQAAESFYIEKKAYDIQKFVGVFKEQWKIFKTQMEKMGASIDTVQKNFTQLDTTRSKALEKPMNKIEAIALGEGSEVDSQKSISDNHPNSNDKSNENLF